jgi:uncharacterized protein (DUF58 family)
MSARFDPGFLRKLQHLAIAARRLARGSARGERKTGRAGGGLEFADHRAYAPGDDPRRIDWNLFGRMERPLVRLFEAEEELPVYVLLDRSASMGLGGPPKLDLAAQVAAALAYLAARAREPVQVHPFATAVGEPLSPLRGGLGFSRFLERLAALAPDGRTDLDAAAAGLLARHRRRGLVVVVSDFFGQRTEAALDRLRHARFEPAVVSVTAAEDRHAPDEDDLVIVDVETRAERAVVLDAASRAAYQRLAGERGDALARFCHRRGFPHVAASAEQPFDAVVLRLMRSRGLLS